MSQEEDEQIQPPVSRNFSSLDRIFGHLSSEAISASAIPKKMFNFEELKLFPTYPVMLNWEEKKKRVLEFNYKLKLQKILDRFNYTVNPDIPVIKVKDVFAFLPPLAGKYKDKPLEPSMTQAERIQAINSFLYKGVGFCLTEQTEACNALHRYNTIWLGNEIYAFLDNYFVHPGSDVSYLERLRQVYNLTPVRREELGRLLVIYENDADNMVEPENILWLFDRNRLKRPMSAMILIED